MPASSAALPDDPSSLAPRILLIEDDSSVADEIVALLEGSGYNVMAAANWPHALLLALGFDAQLVILDTSLPGLSSRAATQVLHSAPDLSSRFQRVPFLYLADRSHIITQRFNHHPDLPTAEYVFKPVDPEILLDRVNRNLQSNRLEDLSSDSPTGNVTKPSP